MTPPRLPTFYLSHGGGPWPWMTGPRAANHAPLATALRELPRRLGTRPEAVLMVSAHWEEPQFTLMTHPNPPLLYDYYNFPESTYRVQYPAPGAPQLAQQVRGLLERAGIAVGVDPQRGFDHGAFVPMAVAWPDADVAIFQLSLKNGLDPAQHVAAGRALAPLRDEGVLIIGSGSSYHNLRALGAEAKDPSAQFDRWLNETLQQQPGADRRTAALLAWEQAPAARLAHPREEHLLPLMVALGAAESEPAARIYHQDDLFGGATVSSFVFGSA